MPVYHETIDNIIGTIHQKDFYLKVFGKGGDVKSIIKPVAVATKTTMVSDLLRMLQKQKLHMAVVVDEFGGTLGIVTMEDIIEELVGEIWDEHDEITEDFIKNADGSYTVLGGAPLEDMFELFGIDEECDINTVSGWVMRELGKIPEEGDSFTSGNISAAVTKTDSRRVQEVLLTVTEPEKTDED